MSFALWKEVLPPTAVDIAIEARFTSPHALNLVVAFGHVLRIYNVVEEQHRDERYDGEEISPADDAEANGDGGSAEETGVGRVARLELQGEFSLMGNVASMAVVRTGTSVGLQGMDSLLLSFKDAKMSLVEYSRATQNIVTVSIHFYEKDEFKKDIMTDRWIPMIHVDPQFRCAALRFFGDQLAILPFKQDGTTRMDSDGTSSRLAARRDSRSLIVISLDIAQRGYPILFRVDQLPYNCTNLIPVPLPVGGVLIQCPNALIHVDQTSLPGMACTFNRFYGLESTLPAPPPSETAGPDMRRDNPLYHESNVRSFRHLEMSLEGAESVFVNPDTLLVVLRTGEMALVELVGSEDGGSGWRRRRGGVKSFKVTRLG
ncbi:Cleavage and polyadenylation specificity factor subunit 1, partial [Irineochytrium annulatum]